MSFAKHKKSLFIFRRDLRLEDNAGLLAALASSESVVPVFIFDPRQIENNDYFSAPAFAFMLESLTGLENDLLNKQAKLYVFRAIAHEMVASLIDHEGIDAVMVNQDYTPFSVNRDFAIAEVCRKKGVPFLSFHDYVLNDPDAVNKKSGGVYTVFTPYFRTASQCTVAEPKSNRFFNYAKISKRLNHQMDLRDFAQSEPSTRSILGGRKQALKILKNIKQFQNYADVRDDPALDATTHLSAHLKFGTCSVREVYCAVKDSLGPQHPLIRQLYWRDFFIQVGFHHPYVLGRAFHEKYDKIHWKNDLDQFSAWCQGKTGFPIVDAGMRELNTTGYMHNRVRMITASFLVKDLHIDWRWGEKYFAQKLVDYDPLVNNGNWQWVASTGCDAQPYFRIFNPWLGQKRFDSDCVYIKKWIPELKALTPREIHGLAQQPLFRPASYPAPIVDHKAASEAAKKFYRAC